MQVVLFDGHEWKDLLPLTYTRPVAELRIGIDTIREKWDNALNITCSILTQPYLQQKYSLPASEAVIAINASFLPNDRLLDNIYKLESGNAILIADKIVAVYLEESQLQDFYERRFDNLNLRSLPVFDWSDSVHIRYPWDLITFNGNVMQSDFARITKGRSSAPISGTNRLLGDNIFAEEGVVAEYATFNTTSGPVYLGKNSEVMEGAMIRGGLALGEGSSIKMGAKLYGPSTFGPHCKIGGEVTNCIFQEYSNKGHDGYLGNSYVGAWCNFGADTNSSNLKNNYKKVSAYSHRLEGPVDTGLQFLGLIMGDHSKTGINTMLNTGTVIGVSSNVFGAGFPSTFIPSFTWGGSENSELYVLEKALEVAQTVMLRRNMVMTDDDRKILTEVFEQTLKYRT